MTAALLQPRSVRPPAAIRPRLRRVLYVLGVDPSQKFGSLEEQAFVLAEAFRRRDGCFVPLFAAAPDAATAVRYRAAGLEAAFLGLNRFRLSCLEELHRLTRRLAIEVVHWNLCPPLLNPYLAGLRLLAPGVRHYFTDHNSRHLPLPPPAGGLGRLVKRFGLRTYARVFGVSRFVVDCLERTAAWPRAEPLLHFINTDRFVPDAAVRTAVRARLEPPGVNAGPTPKDADAFVLVTVAHLIPAKGIDVALRALAELPADVRFWVVGSGPEDAALKRLAEQLGVAGRVRFLGLQTEVQPYLQAADCFVCPSRWAEAAGLVNLEAQACGLPVLYADVGGIGEYVADGVTGLAFAPDDHRGLADAVRRLLDDAAWRRRLAVQARNWVVERFSIDARLDGILDLYRAVA